MKTRNKIFSVVEELTNSGKIPTKADLKEQVDVSERAIQRHTKKLRQDNEIQILNRKGENVYVPYGYDTSDIGFKSLRKKISESIAKIRGIALREPTLEEVALDIGTPPDTELFRNLFFDVASKEGWFSPSEEDISESRQHLKEVVKRALALATANNWEEEHSCYLVGLTNDICDADDTPAYRIRSYYRENRSLLEGFEVLEEEKERAYIKFPDEGISTQQEYPVRQKFSVSQELRPFIGETLTVDLREFLEEPGVCAEGQEYRREWNRQHRKEPVIEVSDS